MDQLQRSPMKSVGVFNCSQGADFLRKRYLEIVESLLSLNATIEDKLEVLKAKEVEGACTQAPLQDIDWLTPFTRFDDTPPNSTATSDDIAMSATTADFCNNEKSPCNEKQDMTEEVEDTAVMDTEGTDTIHQVFKESTCDEVDPSNLDTQNQSDQKKSSDVKKNTRSSKTRESVNGLGNSDENAGFVSFVGSIGRNLFENAQDIVSKATETVELFEHAACRAQASRNADLFKAPQRKGCFRPAPAPQPTDCKKNCSVLPSPRVNQSKSPQPTSPQPKSPRVIQPKPPGVNQPNVSFPSVEPPFFFGGVHGTRWGQHVESKDRKVSQESHKPEQGTRTSRTAPAFKE